MKPGCTFKFFPYLEINLREFINLDSGGPFFTKGPLKLALQGPFGVMKSLEGLDNVFCRIGKTRLKESRKSEYPF